MSDKTIYLVEMDGFTDASTSQTHRFSNGAYATLPTDTPPNTRFIPCILAAGAITSEMFSNGISGLQDDADAEVGFGSIEINNTSGRFDSLFGVAAISFRERPIRVYRVEPGAAFSSKVLVLSGVVGQVQMQLRKIVISIKDRSYELRTPHSTAVYLGNNSLPNGVEGVDDLKGKLKPRVIGRVNNIEPPCVNTSKLIYQVNNGAVVSIVPKDGSSAITLGADYTSQADMEATAPAALEARCWPAGGMFRLGSSPVYKLTADVIENTSGNSTAAQIIKRLAIEAGVSSGDISSADVSALDAANSSVHGWFWDSNEDSLKLMSRFAKSVGAYVGFDQFGTLRMARFEGAPSTPGIAQAIVARWNGGSIESVTTGEDIPILEVKLKCARYAATHSKADLVPTVTDAQRSDLAEEWRVARYAGSISPNPYRRTNVLERETTFYALADAETEAQRLFDLGKVPKRTHRVIGMRLSESALQLLNANSIVEIRWNRWGFDPVVGTNRRVLQVTKHLGRRKCDLIVWGD